MDIWKWKTLFILVLVRVKGFNIDKPLFQCEGIIIWDDRDNSYSEKELLEYVAKYSPESFYELKIHESSLISEDIESFLSSWENRTSKKIT